MRWKIKFATFIANSLFWLGHQMSSLPYHYMISWAICLDLVIIHAKCLFCPFQLLLSFVYLIHKCLKAIMLFISFLKKPTLAAFFTDLLTNFQMCFKIFSFKSSQFFPLASAFALPNFAFIRTVKSLELTLLKMIQSL